MTGPQRAPGSKATRRVLLVEDNPGDARLFREALAEAKGVLWEIEYTGMLASALHRLQRTQIDVIALDLALPDAQGLEAVTQVRATAPSIPIVVLTGLSDEAAGIQAMQEGAEDYLIKGHVAGDRLSGTLQYAIERKHGEEQLLSLLSLLSATLDATSDGILVLNQEGKIARFNRRFLEVWRIPEPTIGAAGHAWVSQEVLDQVREPGFFQERISDVSSHASADAHELLHLKNGRVIESRGLLPRLHGQVIGRVWSFRDVTAPARVEDAPQAPARPGVAGDAAEKKLSSP